MLCHDLVLSSRSDSLTSPVWSRSAVLIFAICTDKQFVKTIYDVLAIDDRRIWVDWEDIPPSNDWLDEIHKGIEQSDVFLFILSPDSIKSEVCNWEVDHAVKNGKRVVPVVCRDVDYREVRKELASLNWIFFRQDGEEFEAAMKLLKAAIDSGLFRPVCPFLSHFGASLCRTQARSISHHSLDSRHRLGTS